MIFLQDVNSSLQSVYDRFKTASTGLLYLSRNIRRNGRSQEEKLHFGCDVESVSADLREGDHERGFYMNTNTLKGGLKAHLPRPEA